MVGDLFGLADFASEGWLRRRGYQDRRGVRVMLRQERRDLGLSASTLVGTSITAEIHPLGSDGQPVTKEELRDRARLEVEVNGQLVDYELMGEPTQDLSGIWRAGLREARP